MTDNNFKINITSEKGVNIQPNMYGLFFEDINYMGQSGGIYAEMIENRSFEQIMHNDCDEEIARKRNLLKKPRICLERCRRRYALQDREWVK